MYANLPLVNASNLLYGYGHPTHNLIIRYETLGYSSRSRAKRRM